MTARCLTLTPLIIGLIGLTAPSAAAQAIDVANGFLDVTGGSISAGGPLILGGNRGFTADAGIGSADQVAARRCMENFSTTCHPGDTVSLSVSKPTGEGKFSAATLDGVSYAPDQFNDMSVQMAGSVVLPPLAASATISASITFSGVFSHRLGVSNSIVNETMSGSSTATLTLVPSTSDANSWRITRVLYVFGSTLPFPWRAADVGMVGRPGSASFSNGTFTIAGSGADIWGTTDGLQYASQRFGDGTIVARVVSNQNTHPFAKAGVMIRQSYDLSSPHVILDVTPTEASSS